MPTARDRTDASATGDSMNNSFDNKLGLLLRRYAETQQAVSWKGSQPISYWEAIESDATMAKVKLKEYLLTNYKVEVKI